MKTLNLRNSLSQAALACLLFIPGLAHANCTSISPSFGYTTVAKAGGQATVGISIAAGCSWQVTSNVSWIRIVSANRGVGPGAVVFQVLPNPNRTTRRGTFGAPTMCDGGSFGRTAVVCPARFTVTIDQYGQ